MTGQIKLVIADDGIGLSTDPGLGSGRIDSLGMSLVKGLGKNLHGKITITTNPGTRIELSFIPLPPPELRVSSQRSSPIQYPDSGITTGI
jgi:two-component sensor histidine kinase